MYDALFEDEDDIFSGSPRSKFMDIVYNANRDLVQAELERLINRQAILEMMVAEKFGDDFDDEINRRLFGNVSEIENITKSLYIESVGNILSQNE